MSPSRSFSDAMGGPNGHGHGQGAPGVGGSNGSGGDGWANGGQQMLKSAMKQSYSGQQHLAVAGETAWAKLEQERLEEEERKRGRELEREEEGALTGCREAVEILTRNPKKGKWSGDSLRCLGDGLTLRFFFFLGA